MNTKSTIAGRLLLAFVLSLGWLLPGAPVSQAQQLQPASPLVVRVQTPDYKLTADGVEVTRFDTSVAAGAPQLPLKGISFELPLTGEYKVSFTSKGERVLDEAVTVKAVPVPAADEIDVAAMQAAGEEITAIPVTDRPDPAIYAADAFYPASPVVVGEAVQQGNQRILFAQVFPFQYNPVTHQLRYYPDIEVTVTVDPATVNPNAKAKQPAEFYQASAALPGDGILRVHTRERGFYRLTYTDLSNAGVPVGAGGANPSSFAMYYKGQPIDIEVRGGQDGVFDAGDLVVFYAIPYDDGRYQDYNIYHFAYGGGVTGARIGSRTVTTPATAPTAASVVMQTLRIENNVYYMHEMSRPDHADHFTDAVLSVTSSTPTTTKNYSFTPDDIVLTGGGTVQANVLLYGTKNTGFSPDKYTQLKLNSQAIGSYLWDGMVEQLLTATIPASSFVDGANQLSLIADRTQLPIPVDYTFAPDWIELLYPAKADAESNAIYIQPQATFANPIAVSGFSTSPVRVFDVRDASHPLQLNGPAATASGTVLQYWNDSVTNPAYMLFTDAALRAPGAIERDLPSNWASASNAYNYVAIVGTERTYTGTTALGSQLKAAAQALLNYRATDGFSVVAIDVQDIYDEWSHGRMDPMAIRSFLSNAYFTWSTPPEYVVLVGDGHYDFNKTITSPVQVLPNLIPPYLSDLDPSWGEVPADNRYVSVDSASDNLPNMAIGRIPAVTAADVTKVVNKIIAYENPITNPGGNWQSRAIYVADDCRNSAGNFHVYNNTLITDWLDPSYDSRTAYYDPSNTCPYPDYQTSDAMRTAIRAEQNQGAFFMQWFGHASEYRWGYSASVYNFNDPAALNPNTNLVFSVANACLSGYFVVASAFQNKQSMGENMVLADGRGSIADLSPSGLHTGYDLMQLARGMHLALFTSKIPRVGDVADYARYYYIQGGTHSVNYAADVVDTMILFGDPATKLRYPDPLDTLTTALESNRDWLAPSHVMTGTLIISGGTPSATLPINAVITLPPELSAPTSLSSTTSTPVYNAAARTISWTGDAPGANTIIVQFTSVVQPAANICSNFLVSSDVIYDGHTQTETVATNLIVPDVNCSGLVTVADIQTVASRWPSVRGDALYNPRYDLNADDAITIADIVADAEAWH